MKSTLSNKDGKKKLTFTYGNSYVKDKKSKKININF